MTTDTTTRRYAAAFAARAIKNVEPFSQVLPFAYDSATGIIESNREDR